MEHTFPAESFQRENRTTFLEVPFIPEIFQWNEPKTCVPFTSQPEFPEFLGKWKTPLVSFYIGVTSHKLETNKQTKKAKKKQEGL